MHNDSIISNTHFRFLLCIKYMLVLAPPHPTPIKIEEDESKNIAGLLLALHSNVFIRSQKAVLQQISCIITNQCCLSCTLWVWKSRLFQDIIQGQLKAYFYYSSTFQGLCELWELCELCELLSLSTCMYFKGQKLKSRIKYNLLHHEARPYRVQEGLMLQCTVVNVNECGTEILTAYPTLKLSGYKLQ